MRISQENARLRIPAQQNPQHLAAVSRKKPSITVPLPQASELGNRLAEALRIIASLSETERQLLIQLLESFGKTKP
jgi:hypothetical protein